MDDKIILVDRAWFEKLNEYLTPELRFPTLTDENTLIFYTPNGIGVVFKIEEIKK